MLLGRPYGLVKPYPHLHSRAYLGSGIIHLVLYLGFSDFGITRAEFQIYPVMGF